MDPMQTLPLLPWRRGTACTRLCSSLCVSARRARGRGGGVGDCSPAPKRFVSAKRFPCPSQMAGHASPLAAEKEEQREHRRRSDTCVSA